MISTLSNGCQNAISNMESCPTCRRAFSRDQETERAMQLPCSEYHVRCVRCYWPTGKNVIGNDGYCSTCARAIRDNKPKSIGGHIPPFDSERWDQSLCQLPSCDKHVAPHRKYCCREHNLHHLWSYMKAIDTINQRLTAK